MKYLKNKKLAQKKLQQTNSECNHLLHNNKHVFIIYKYCFQAFLKLVQMEQEQAEKDRKKEEEERKRKAEERKRRKRMLEAAFDGDNEEMLQIIKEVCLNNL